MIELEYRKKITLSDLISEIISNETSEEFCIYTEKYEPAATPNLNCYIENYPIVNESDEELYPDFVIQNNLELFYYGNQFLDVINNTKHQKETASTNDFISALNYYLDNDDFITI